jgi:catechol 2,3-dioxygenase-like lactoylglutathione lyase family enzyme
MTVMSFRVALTTNAFAHAVAFYRDGLGLEPGEFWRDNGRGQLFWAGKASLEIFDPDYATKVDQIEAGERLSGQIRFAFEVPDVQVAMARAVQYGATLVHEPVLTPWGDLNVRLRSPEGLQVTLFQTHIETTVD